MDENRCTINMTVPDESSSPTRIDSRCMSAAHYSGDGLCAAWRAHDLHGDGVLQADEIRVRKRHNADFARLLP